MKGSRMKASFAAILGFAMLLATTAAASAFGIVPADERESTDCYAEGTGSPRVVKGHSRCSRSTIGVSWSHAPATGHESMLEQIGPRADVAGGTSGPADAQGKKGPEGNDSPGADDGIGMTGAVDPSVTQRLPRGKSGAPSADCESANARGPPAGPSPMRTAQGA
jgi:hypothetical protein